MDPTSLVSAKWIVNDSASNDSVSSLLVAGPCKLKMLSFANEANEPGLLVLRDGTVTGDIKLQIFVGQGPCLPPALIEAGILSGICHQIGSWSVGGGSR